MAIAIYEDLAGRRYWADSTSSSTIRNLARGDWLLYDDTPSTPPPATDPLGAEMAERVPGTGPFAAALRAAFVAPVAANTTRFMAELKTASRDLSWLILGDSTGNETTEWVRLTAGDLATRWPAWTVIYHLWDDATSAWDATPAVTVQTGTGARTLHIWNASVAGKSTDYFLAPNIDPLITDRVPDLVMINLGKNESGVTSTSAALWRGQAQALIEAVKTRAPTADICWMAQNPTLTMPGATDDGSMAARIAEYRRLVGETGIGYLDVHRAFLDDSRGLAALTVSDGIHPNTTGSRLWADTVLGALVYTGQAPHRTQPGPTILQVARNLLPDFASFTGAAPAGWELIGATAFKDLAHAERYGYGVRVQATGAAASQMRYVLTAAEVGEVAGRWLTVAVRVRVPSGQNSTAGRIGIYDSDGSTSEAVTSRGLQSARDGFATVILSKRIRPGTTTVRVLLYGDTAATASADVTYAWASAVIGRQPYTGLNAGPAGPAGSAGAGSPAEHDYQSTVGAGSPALALALASSNVTFATASTGVAVPIRPRRNISLTTLRWYVGITGGNYDIAVLDATGTRLWSKGSTAVPAVGAVTETVSPTLVLTAGTLYWIELSMDGTTAAYRGLTNAFPELLRMLDGTLFARTISSQVPIPASVSLGSVGSTRLPVVVLGEA